MQKKTFLKEQNLTEDQFSGKEKIGGDLYLRSVTSLPAGFNPTVGGYLDLGSVTSLFENLTTQVNSDFKIERKEFNKAIKLPSFLKQTA